MALMHGHVNEWDSVKARNKCRNPDLSMLKDKQACEAKAQRLIEPKTYEKKLNEQPCEGKNKTNKEKLGFLGSSSHTQEQAYAHIIGPTCAGKIMRTQILA